MRLFTDGSATLPLPEMVLRRVLDGSDAVLFGGYGGSKASRALLDPVAALLARSRCRVLRVDAAVGTPGLPGMAAQLTGRTARGAPDDGAVAAAYKQLTSLDETCSRIVLLVGNAHLLRPGSLRFLQIACGAGPELRLVLAGRHGFLDLLAGDEFAPLRSRLAAGGALTPVPARALPVQAPARASLPPGRAVTNDAFPAAPRWPAAATAPSWKRLALRAGGGLAVASFALLGLWLGEGAERAQPLQHPAGASQAAAPLPGALVPGALALAPGAQAVDPATGSPSPALAGAGTGMPAAPAGSPALTSAAVMPAGPPQASAAAPQPDALPAAPSRQAETRSDARPRDPHPASQAASRRSAPAQPRATAAASAGPGDPRYRRDPDEPAVRPPYDTVPQRPPWSPNAWWGTAAADPYAATPYIGTYAAGANGERSFRFGP